MYTSSNFTSDLINSYAWDTAIVFIQTFGTESNSKAYSRQNGITTNTSYPSITGTGILKKTNKEDKQCNIYDMAGNCREWTTETYSYFYGPCMYRGGSYYDSIDYTSLRNYRSTTVAYCYDSFRPILYL